MQSRNVKRSTDQQQNQRGLAERLLDACSEVIPGVDPTGIDKHRKVGLF